MLGNFNGNCSEKTGATISLGNSSGVVTNANGVQIVSYRGEENLWGNMSMWLEGLNVKKVDGLGKVYITDNTFTDSANDMLNYEDTGLCVPQTSGYISAFGYNEKFDWLFIPSKAFGTSQAPIGDKCSAMSSNICLYRVGGCLYSEQEAGMYCMESTIMNDFMPDIGGRLVYVPTEN